MKSALIYVCFLVMGFAFTGCVSEPALVVKKHLHNSWEFKERESSEWYNAEVPGVVHTDLFNNGIIEDPFYRANEDSVQWISKKDWVYRSLFDVTREDLVNDNIDLVFDGLDTHASVYLNGDHLMDTDNMFREWSKEVRDLLVEGENNLEIIFKSPEKYNIEQAAKLPYELPEDERVHSRKAQYQFGWDWGPVLITSGIWRPVYLRMWNQARIDNVFLETAGIDDDNAYVKGKVRVEASDSSPLEITISSPDNLFTSVTKTVSVDEGLNEFYVKFEIADPQLWWANGMGEPYLYNVDISISCDTGADTVSERIGIRTIELVQNPDEYGSSFEFYLNGEPFFAKGANYIPLESFPSRLTYEDYESALEDAVKANYNMLRMWGGGIYEDKIFYDLCDEKGILIWQDFMFACAMYPGDDHFLENVKNEIEYNVERLRNHPSIALWCGNNEIYNGWFDWNWQTRFNYSKEDSLTVWNDYQTIFHELIPQVLEEKDPGRDYWPSSPLYGWGHEIATRKGDNHYWGVWWGMEPFEMYREKVSRFMSEFGFQSFPAWSTIKEFTIAEDRELWSDVMLSHQKHPVGNETIKEYMQRWYPEPKNFEKFVYVSQIMQAQGVGDGIAAHREAMPYSMGTLYWQFNDCWPVTSWSSRDYYGNWKPLHYYVRRIYEPLALSATIEDDNLKVFVISDLRELVDGELYIDLVDFNGSVISSIEVDFEAESNRGNLVYESSVDELINDLSVNNIALSISASVDNYDLSDIYHYFSLPKEMALQPVNYDIDVVKSTQGYRVTLSSDYLSRHTRLNIDGYSGWWSDNYFDLIPGDKKVIVFETEETITDFEEKLTVISLVDAF
ncbi:glycoside hydrolase family 2 protein [Marinilabiliaceae bacterium ANBcel2]|nr:glycoside hydrolase family 2 protein [Marinilabiliaceae bacterium ANBcel2]